MKVPCSPILASGPFTGLPGSDHQHRRWTTCDFQGGLDECHHTHPGCSCLKTCQKMATKSGSGKHNLVLAKKPYALKLESKTSLLGMPKHSAIGAAGPFHGPYNASQPGAYKIAQSALLWHGLHTMRNNLELIFNGRPGQLHAH